MIPLTLENLEIGLTVTLRPEDQTHGAYGRYFGKQGKIVSINPQRGNAAPIVQVKWHLEDDTDFSGNEITIYSTSGMFYYRLLICEGEISLEELKRTAIERKIKMLHTRQLFYLANKESLPSWG